MEYVINIYTDESCHTGADGQNIVIGALWCKQKTSRWLAENVKLLRVQHGIALNREIKWTKVSSAKLDYYKSLVDLFAQGIDVHFRAIVINKEKIDHEKYNSSEDDFYYRMNYILIRNIAEKNDGEFRIFMDYKDSWSNEKSQRLAKYLSHTTALAKKSFEAQPARSYEVVALQITDLLIGAVMYANKPRLPGDSPAKLELLRYIEKNLGQILTQETPYGISKFNILLWEPYS